MIKVGDLKLKNVIVCDDIRVEKSNKLILIGVFPADILVKELPAAVSLAIYIDGNISRSGDNTAKFRFSGPGDDSAELAVGFKQVENQTKFSLRTPRFEMLIEQEGVFKIELENNGKWATIAEKLVILEPDSFTA